MLCLFLAVFSFSSPEAALASTFRVGVDDDTPAFAAVERDKLDAPAMEAGRPDKDDTLCGAPGLATGVGVPATDILPRIELGGGPIEPSIRFDIEPVPVSAGLGVDPLEDVDSIVLTREDFTSGVLLVLLT